jgi:hypothetical protein
VEGPAPERRRHHLHRYLPNGESKLVYKKRPAIVAGFFFIIFIWLSRRNDVYLQTEISLNNHKHMKKIFITLLIAVFVIPATWAIEPDSIRKNLADLDSLIHMVETNYAGFPIIGPLMIANLLQRI